MADSEQDGVDVAQAWDVTVSPDDAIRDPPASAGAGILPFLPPGARVIVSRRLPMWAKGNVDTITLGDDRTITVDHVDHIRKYHGGGEYEFKAQVKGKFVKDGAGRYTIAGTPMEKGNPHPNDPDRAMRQQPHPMQPGSFASQGQQPFQQPADPIHAQLAHQVEWMRSQLEEMYRVRGMQPPAMPPTMGAPPPGYPPQYQHPPGYPPSPYVNTYGHPQPPPPQYATPAYGSPTDPFGGVRQTMEMVKLLRSFDGYDEEEEEEEDGMPDGTPPMPKNLEEAASMWVWSNMRESERKAAADAPKKEQPTGPRLIKAGTDEAARMLDGGAAPAAGAPPAPTTAAAAETTAAPTSFPDMLAKMQSLPPEQQATMLLTAVHTITQNADVAAEMRRQTEAMAKKEQGGAA